MSFKEKFIAFFGVLGKFVSVLFKEALQKELVVVVPLARQIIAELAFDPTMLTSSDKRNAAIARIGMQLLSQQKTVGQDIIRLAIELAYQDFKISPEAVKPVVTVSAPVTPVV